MAHSKWSTAIDISHWQGEVDIPYIVRASGGLVKTVIAKAIQYGYGWTYEQCVDRRWAANVQGCADAGIPCGGYIYLDAAYNLRQDAQAFASNQQTQFIIRALQNKLYHFIAIDVEEGGQEALKPIQWLSAVRLQFDHLKHARKNGLIRNVPIGLYSRNSFIADYTVAPDGGSLFDDTPLHEFLWEAKYMLPPTNPVKAWSQLKECYPPDTLHPTGMNGIQYWTAANPYPGNMVGKVVFWQFADYWKFPAGLGKTPQAFDLNLILTEDQDFYSWLQFVPPTTPTDPPEEPEEPGEPEDPDDPPEYTDLAPILTKLDRLIEQNDDLLDILREVYNR